MSITVAPTPVPRHGGFGVPCAAVEGLWRSFAAEFGPHGIRLVILRSAGSPDAPDIKQTFEHHARAAGISPEEFLAEASSGTLLRRLPMLSEVAEAAVMMASDRASAMTGVMANVTCGFWVDVSTLPGSQGGELARRDTADPQAPPMPNEFIGSREHNWLTSKVLSTAVRAHCIQSVSPPTGQRAGESAFALFSEVWWAREEGKRSVSPPAADGHRPAHHAV